jgi:hypothetical protein
MTAKGKAKPSLKHNPPERCAIERTYQVRIPSGEIREVNIFQYNLQYAVAQVDDEAKEGYIQLEDTSWAKLKMLEVIMEADRDG